MHLRKASSLLQSASASTYWPCLVSTSQEFPADKYKNRPGSRFTDGDPLGFWPQYGLTIICYPSEGLKPFDELFTSILGTTLGGVFLSIAVLLLLKTQMPATFLHSSALSPTPRVKISRWAARYPWITVINDEDDDDEAAQEECMIGSSHPTNYEPCP